MAPLTVFTLHVLASKVFNIYGRFPHFDKPMHVLGGIAIDFWFHVASLRGSAFGVLGPYHRVTHCLLVFGWTCVAAVFWEFAEWLSGPYRSVTRHAGGASDPMNVRRGVCSPASATTRAAIALA